MYAIIVWLEENTLVPSVIGPYEGDLAFSDADVLRKQCHKVVVTQITTPDKVEVFAHM